MTLWRSLTLLAAPLVWRSLFVLLAAGAFASQLIASSAAPELRPLQPAAAGRLSHPLSRERAVLASYPAIAQHPLFFPSRRPWVPPPEPARSHAASPMPPLTGYTVIGTVVSDGVRRAIVRPPNGDKPIVLAEGQELNGWTLRSITGERLRFEGGGTSFELEFPKSGSRRSKGAGR